jgi:hypothetical protein
LWLFLFFHGPRERRTMRTRQSFREQQDREQAARAADGLVSERYADVSGISFRMTYYHRALDPILMTRTLSFLPADYASFHLKCMQEGCSGGGYDLAPVVAGLARSRKRSVKGKIFCHGTNDTIGHGSIDYEVSIEYVRQRSERP